MLATQMASARILHEMTYKSVSTYPSMLFVPQLSILELLLGSNAVLAYILA